MPDLTITISIPTAQRARVLNGFAKAHDKKASDNRTKEEFFKDKLQEYAEKIVYGQEANDELEAAKLSASKKPLDLGLSSAAK